ncbi:phosphatidylglycerophosphatase A [Streptococcus pneumoniae]|nr:phosphatidylglycerophosphatase A [Streptococcus pneumoniae]
MEKDNPLYGIDEVIVLSILNLYGSMRYIIPHFMRKIYLVSRLLSFKLDNDKSRNQIYFPHKMRDYISHFFTIV